jgi:acyl-CoA synthetase (AMP-forming)/AMP-acid ligase II
MVSDDSAFYHYGSVSFGQDDTDWNALMKTNHKKFEEKWNKGRIETMGLTETCAPILSNPLPPGKIKHGSPGLAYGNEVKILDSNFKEVEINTIGQICVKGMNVMKEYYKNPEETNKSFHNDWLLTGDLGLMDEDQYVFVRGSIKELIIKGGENISPREIDDDQIHSCLHPLILNLPSTTNHYGNFYLFLQDFYNILSSHSFP